jgi:hypothetical protein
LVESIGAIIQSVKLDVEEALQKEIELQRGKADDLELARQKNQQTFKA